MGTLIDRFETAVSFLFNSFPKCSNLRLDEVEMPKKFLSTSKGSIVAVIWSVRFPISYNTDQRGSIKGIYSSVWEHKSRLHE